MLTDLERDVLDFESRFPQAHSTLGAREGTVTELLGITPTRYAQILTQLLSRSDAWAYAPSTMKRLYQRVERRIGGYNGTKDGAAMGPPVSWPSGAAGG